ncbi:MAG: tetratricopeptide repeat protein [Candidatus Gracilibacteria bacterium]
MKKKTLSWAKPGLLLSFLLLGTVLTACNSKWQGDISNLDEGWIAHQYEIIDEFEQKLEANPEDAEALFEIAFRYQQLEDYKTAIKYYKKTLEANPDNVTVYNNLANIYETVEEYDLAAENIMVYFQNNQTSVEAVKDAVRVLLLAGDPENAQIALDTYAMQTSDESSPEHTQFLSDLKGQIYDYEVAHNLK